MVVCRPLRLITFAQALELGSNQREHARWHSGCVHVRACWARCCYSQYPNGAVEGPLVLIAAVAAAALRGRQSAFNKPLRRAINVA